MNNNSSNNNNSQNVNYNKNNSSTNFSPSKGHNTLKTTRPIAPSISSPSLATQSSSNISIFQKKKPLPSLPNSVTNAAKSFANLPTYHQSKSKDKIITAQKVTETVVESFVGLSENEVQKTKNMIIKLLLPPPFPFQSSDEFIFLAAVEKFRASLASMFPSATPPFYRYFTVSNSNIVNSSNANSVKINSGNNNQLLSKDCAEILNFLLFTKIKLKSKTTDISSLKFDMKQTTLTPKIELNIYHRSSRTTSVFPYQVSLSAKVEDIINSYLSSSLFPLNISNRFSRNAVESIISSSSGLQFLTFKFVNIREYFHPSMKIGDSVRIQQFIKKQKEINLVIVNMFEDFPELSPYSHLLSHPNSYLFEYHKLLSFHPFCVLQLQNTSPLSLSMNQPANQASNNSNNRQNCYNIFSFEQPFEFKIKRMELVNPSQKSKPMNPLLVPLTPPSLPSSLNPLIPLNSISTQNLLQPSALLPLTLSAEYYQLDVDIVNGDQSLITSPIYSKLFLKSSVNDKNILKINEKMVAKNLTIANFAKSTKIQITVFSVVSRSKSIEDISSRTPISITYLHLFQSNSKLIFGDFILPSLPIPNSGLFLIHFF